MATPKIFQKSPIVRPTAPGVYWWCACGRSANQPFCDGSHQGTTMTPKKVEITETRSIAWCACKHSKKTPFCDGSHNHLD